MKKRIDGRAFQEARKLQIVYDPFGYADGSVLLSLGSTKVLASVTLQSGVPQFLKGKGHGWLTAEYAMLPTATQQRSMRDSVNMQKNGRSVEISRLVGRALRTIISCDALGEKTIYVDCDVLQADGSTRVASIMAASMALHRAEAKWLEQKRIKEPIIKDTLLAVSVGVTQENVILVDLNQIEDNQVIADFNFVMTMDKHIIEIQGTAEKRPLPSAQFDQIKNIALQSVDGIGQILKDVLASHKQVQENADEQIIGAVRSSGKKAGLFSLERRLDVP